MSQKPNSSSLSCHSEQGSVPKKVQGLHPMEVASGALPASLENQSVGYFGAGYLAKVKNKIATKTLTLLQKTVQGTVEIEDWEDIRKDMADLSTILHIM